MKKKLLSRGGFTLVEMLAALLVFVLVAGMITGVTTSSVRVYRQMLFESESRMLISTVNTALGDILKFADDVTVGEKKSGSDYSSVSGFRSMETYTIPGKNSGAGATYYKYGINGGTVRVNSSGLLEYTRYDGDESGKVLITEDMYHEMTVEDFSLSYNGDGVFMISYTVKSSDGTMIQESGDFCVNALT